jgi:hypothetical protein
LCDVNGKGTKVITNIINNKQTHLKNRPKLCQFSLFHSHFSMISCANVWSLTCTTLCVKISAAEKAIDEKRDFAGKIPTMSEHLKHRFEHRKTNNRFYFRFFVIVKM